jgi:hypothetical protein
MMKERKILLVSVTRGLLIFVHTSIINPKESGTRVFRTSNEIKEQYL